MKTMLRRVLPVVLGAAGFLLRLLQRETAFEADTCLSLPAAPASRAMAVYLAAAGALLLFQAVREKREKKLDLAAGFLVPTQGMLSILVCAGMLMAAGGALLAWDGVQRGDVVSAALGGFAAVAAVCLLLAMSRWRREERCGGLLTMPALLCVVWLLVTYRQYADYPVLEELYIQILAIAAFTYGFYQTAAYDFALGSRRPTRFVLPAAVVLGMTALADDLSLGLICLYVGCTVVLYAFSLLERPAGPD